MVLPVRRTPWPVAADSDPESLLTREWLVTNGLGGYASGTIAGVITRRYHGFLIAALPAPLGRVVMLSHLAERLRWPDGRRAEIGGPERPGDTGDAEGTGYLVEFRLEGGLPIWRYDVDGVILEKQILLVHLQNTVHVRYTLLAGADQIEMALRPSVNFRAQDAPVNEPLAWPYEFRAVGDGWELVLAGSELPALRLLLCAEQATFTLKGKRLENVQYPVEESRGYHARGDLWSPGYYRFMLCRGQSATAVASTESFETMMALDPPFALDAERRRRGRLLAQAVPEARHGIPAELVLAADQFIVTPAGRTADALRARASGDEVRTIIAGYPWFTDWGRDTMISLEGLTLVTGRHVEAGYILRTFAHYVRDGLIPNLFPDGKSEGLYHTADASLWFFHAIDRYLEYSRDELTLATLYPTLVNIVDAYANGTRFGISMDPRDGLIMQGAAGYQLTWMDAKVDDWVVTPRRGKAVEINALWYNALRLMERWAATLDPHRSAEFERRAAHAAQSFNERFWCAERQYLYDVVDGESGLPGGVDPSCRPNQILAISLPNPVLARDRWEPVLNVVRDRLLTPVGLRSLASDDADFKPRYFGDLRARDAAYHQGTVWGWLIGPFMDAWCKVHPEDEVVPRRARDGFTAHLNEACLGSISEIFDAEPPFTPRGCIAQAWSVAEVLRVWVAAVQPARGATRAATILCAGAS
jgi:predicted glycogen debranching enzyme